MVELCSPQSHVLSLFFLILLESPSITNQLDIINTSPVIRKGKLYRFSQTTSPSAPELDQLINNSVTFAEYNRKYKTQTSHVEENILQNNRISLTPSTSESSSSSNVFEDGTGLDHNQVMFSPYKIHLERSDSMDILKDFKNLFLVRKIAKGILKALGAIAIIAVVIALAV